MKDVRSLHAGIQYLRGLQYLLFCSSHDLAAAKNTIQRRMAGNLHDFFPIIHVFNSIISPEKLNFINVHAACLPYLNKIVANQLNSVKVAPHLVVCPGMPVRHPHLESAACLEHLVHINSAKNPLGNMNPAGWLKAIIGNRCFFSFKKVAQVVKGNDLFTNLLKEVKPALNIHSILERMA